MKEKNKLVFSDFQLSDYVKKTVLQEIGTDNPEAVKNALSHVRMFTGITDEGIAQEGTLRSCRCVNKGLYFYSEVSCKEDDEKLIKEVLPLIKWIGSMRNRGFGKVNITVED